MRPVNVWRTDEPCPSCGAGMFLLDDGFPLLLAECRLCGYAEEWAGTENTAGGDDW